SKKDNHFPNHERETHTRRKGQIRAPALPCHRCKSKQRKPWRTFQSRLRNCSVGDVFLLTNKPQGEVNTIFRQLA
ncbi:MAG TPA: hypothetical protein VN682_21290, partial [Terriglobales bacterium]|nr:hypothetical protein [Terriglobales bacterium]